MATVLLVLHIMIAAALVGVILLQRAEAGGLVSGGGGGGFLSGRGTANLLTRTTSVLAALFFLTSILLTMLAQQTSGSRSLFDDRAGTTRPSSQPAVPGAPPAATGTGTPAAPGQRGGVLDELERGSTQRLPQLPATR